MLHIYVLPVLVFNKTKSIASVRDRNVAVPINGIAPSCPPDHITKISNT